ncbi:hypothetical protein N7499_000857 [Penicillium canescens]|uniref:F-box domain-containing protein n=1 Tax=Penicillium canescens TaxID=5083 RepID=A0AAD6IJE0_PENCN|nr:uncharacterized protein N7446_010939 [Penicillium canescens]KAJ6029710.1 hypothetical protein N7444_012697 [Penicillium canescens]KAJ6048142.1 hypothetical protein N7460_004289 [Penicillium canescens]KAJ6048256.1 hypothetical protein N7446_010939 [Penicillium canescens]KAJ6101227.1 hypothetical protein N7499_000857 [Penicillium canescens]KAJ6173685.1 hypothetical protein N7485_006497 [Penicillium canescens]
MQPEPTAVSQRATPVDSSQVDPSSTQHGHDLDDAQVSDLLEREKTRDSTDVPGMPVQGEQHASVNVDGRPAPPQVDRVSQYENAGTPGTPPMQQDDLAFRVVASTGQLQGSLETFPNEVLTHILSHLPPQSLSAITLVSRRFHALVTTPHAWRIAFSRFFPGPQAVEDDRHATANDADLLADRRYFTRLTALASWRSEYILRTRLMRSLSRGKPAQFEPPKRNGTVRTASARHGSAIATYTSNLLFPVSHIHGSFSPDKDPHFIHAAAEQGIASASDPSTIKVGTWGVSDHQMFRHFADLFPGEAQYGLGAGDMVGLPNVMDVSQPYGMVYGEACPQGRSYFISTTEQRGRFLVPSELGSHPKLGIPAVNMITHAVCSVWIAKSSNILKMTEGLIGMMSGSSSGVLTAYSLGPHPTYEKRYERGQPTAKWVLSPGVPIIGIAVDEQCSTKRQSERRIWAVALNALGEVFHLTELPRQPDIPFTAKLDAEQLDELAWKTGRSVRWELVEASRRVARPDPFNRELVDGSYSPRSSSDSMALNEYQIAAETKEIEKFLSFKPKHFRKVCESWNMQRDLKVDFAGGDGRGVGESVIVIVRGSGEDEQASIKRFTRSTSIHDLASPTPESRPLATPPPSLFGGPTTISTPPVSSVPSSRSSSRMARSATTNYEWRLSEFIFGDRKSVEISTTAFDTSTFATITAEEDPLLAMSGSSHSSATSSPMLPHMEQPRSSLDVPGQRARYLAVGTKNGMVFVWNIRAPAAPSTEIINSISPLRIIQTDSPQVSCLAVTSLYLVHGGNDGLVQAWDPLASSTRPIRTINSRFSSRARRRLVQAEASVLGVGNNFYATGAICLDTDPTVLRGMVSLGTHLRYWSYSSSAADQYKTSKRRLRRLMRGNNSTPEGQRFNNSGRGAIQDYIEDERVEMERQKIADEKERAHLSQRFGVDLLGPDVDEEQLLMYAQLLSQEAYSGDATKNEENAAVSSSVTSASFPDTVGPSSFGLGDISSSSSPYQDPVDDNDDDELAEAIRLSLLAEQGVPPPFDLTPSIPIKYAKGMQPRQPSPGAQEAEGSRQQEMDDLEFAIQLSLAEGNSRGEDQEREEFPSLAPPMSTSPSGKGKGKVRAIWD